MPGVITHGQIRTPRISLGRTAIVAAFVALLTLVAACGDEVNGDSVNNGADDQTDIGAPNGDDDDSGVPPLYEIVEADSEDGTQSVAAITYGQPPTAHMDALLEGELARNGECLGVATPFDDGFVSVVWPAGFSVGFEDGIAVLIDNDGDVLAREGEPVSLGGGKDRKSVV